jgi:hypothetical protein
VAGSLARGRRQVAIDFAILNRASDASLDPGAIVYGGMVSRRVYKTRGGRKRCGAPWQRAIRAPSPPGAPCGRNGRSGGRRVHMVTVAGGVRPRKTATTPSKWQSGGSPAAPRRNSDHNIRTPCDLIADQRKYKKHFNSPPLLASFLLTHISRRPHFCRCRFFRQQLRYFLSNSFCL